MAEVCGGDKHELRALSSSGTELLSCVLCLLCPYCIFSVNCVFCVFLQYFGTVVWVL